MTAQNEINELYIHISCNLESLLKLDEPCASAVSNNSSGDSLHNNQSQIRLPKIDLPKFSGDLTTWTSFINLFDSTIHNNSSLNDVMRFQYLLSSLEKEPLSLIRSLSITSQNYSIAYELLRDRYHNNRRLQLLHLNKLLDLPSLSASNIQCVRSFVNEFNENSQALSALDCKIEESNPVMVAVLLRKLDVNLKKKLEEFRASSASAKATDSSPTQHTLPSVNDILNFLTTECTHLEDASLLTETHSQTRNKPPVTYKTFPRKSVSMLTTTSQANPQSNSHENNAPLSCFACNETSHKIYLCPVFKSKTPKERYQLVKHHKKCVSCLGNHVSKSCKSQSMCKICNKRHHTLLHFNDVSTEMNSSNSLAQIPKSQSLIKENPSSKSDSVIPVLTSQNSPQIPATDTTVLLGTLLVQLSSPDGNSHVFRALIDSGSMCNLITEYAANLLNARRHRSDIQLSGIDHHVTGNKGQIFVDFKTLSGKVVAANQPTLILDKLTVDLPRAPLSKDVLELTRSYTLADPTFHIPSRIDIVIGGSIFPHLFTQEHISLGDNMPYAVGTHFGFVILGTTPCLPTSLGTPASTLNVCLHSQSHSMNDCDLQKSIQRFWIQEEPPACSSKSQEEILCDEHFEKTHTRGNNGRYMVRLPFKDSDSPTMLGESKAAAELRLSAMERKFKSNPHFSELYNDFMCEYSSLGHMSKCNDIDLNQPHYFLPHHGVLKESSSTTKLRTVFDASSKSTSGKSLNDILLTGRKLQNNITDLLMHFRQHNIVFCCDIRQMYRQIVVHPDDRQFQLILWRETSDSPVSVYKLNTVTYGINSSPYLAIRVLHQLADDEESNLPNAAHILRNHTYVDDIIAGADSEEEAISLQNQVISILERGCFELRKWFSNSPRLLSNLPCNHLESPKFLSGDDSDTPHFKVLGLQWSPTTDSFTYNFQQPSESKPPTKRSVLSTISQIYDPLGFLVPFIMLAKCFMQLLWTKGLSWDSPLTPDVRPQWLSFIDNVKWLANISIPRSLSLSKSCSIQLHGFCDASEAGYAAVTYLRCESPDQTVSISLLMAKSRVAPLKKVTIPRLELCSAHLLAQIAAHIKSVFSDRLTFDNIHLWCDSSVALTWLQTPPYRLKTYVANRVAQTQELVPVEAWRHISSEHNPADCASRGLLVSQLIDHPLWWQGPSWLKFPQTEWPMPKFTASPLEITRETKEVPIMVTVTQQVETFPLLSRFSSWVKLQRVMAYVLRFINCCRSKVRRDDFLSVNELRSSRLKIFELVQKEAFSVDLSLIQKQLDCTKRIQRLSPFIDSDGLLRVGGRLKSASISYDMRHPILLPKHHHVVNILIDYYHLIFLHSGPQLTQAMLTRTVWILSARSVIRSRIYKCIPCFKQRPKNTTPLMGDLPPSRVLPAKPFTSTGIDYCGPFSIKMLNLRFIKIIKVYLCIFVCMVTKAIHIEVVTDMTTDAFIAALTRFVSRRGLCSDIYSDCGTTFIGAQAVLRNIVQSTIQGNEARSAIQFFTANQGINFHFNPPASPHQGGLWESAVKRIKYHLHRVIGETVLTLPQFITLSTQIEAMLNSRPLTPLSNDPSDLSVLTPGHFLCGGPLTAVPENDHSNIPTNRLQHWQQIQQLQQNIWHRWKSEYLHTLQQRTKWTKTINNLYIGQMVILNIPSSPREWSLGRIIKVYPGADNVVRVVKVKTSMGEFKRPVVKICPLPMC